MIDPYYLFKKDVKGLYRFVGMGNIGVATADIATAPFANPAMLSFQKGDDDFSLLIGVGGFLCDSDGMIDDIDRFQTSKAAYDAAVAVSVPDATTLAVG